MHLSLKYPPILIILLLCGCVSPTDNNVQQFYTRHFDGERTPLSGDAGPVSDEQRRAILEKDIGHFFLPKDAALKAFFVKEAMAAGVTRFGATAPLPGVADNKNGKRHCGLARLSADAVEIDITRNVCMNLLTFAHEIAHVDAFAVACYGHGDTFYRILEAIAVRFEKEFPLYRWSGDSPVNAVRHQAQTYRTAEDRCTS